MTIIIEAQRPQAFEWQAGCVAEYPLRQWAWFVLNWVL